MIPAMDTLKPILIRLDNDTGYKRLLDNTKDTAGVKSGCVVLKPGDSVGEHSTKNREEIIIFIEGIAEVYSSKGEKVVAEKNSIVYMPPETKHDVKNVGTKDLRYVYIASPIRSG